MLLSSSLHLAAVYRRSPGMGRFIVFEGVLEMLIHVKFGSTSAQLWMRRALQALLQESVDVHKLINHAL